MSDSANPKKPGAICPSCGSGRVIVTNTRLTPEGRTRRRRKCPDCGKRWSTIEIETEKLAELERPAP